MLQRRAGQALHSCSWARVGVEEGRIFSQGLQFVPSNKEHQAWQETAVPGTQLQSCCWGDPGLSNHRRDVAWLQKVPVVEKSLVKGRGTAATVL